MTRLRTSLLVAAGLAAGLPGPAFAQGTGAPAGMESATAPGGTEGRAGARNEAEAIRSGDAIAVPPAEGIPVERVPAAPDTPMPPPALRQ